MFQKTKLREELVVLTAKFKKPLSQRKKQEVCNQENVILCQNVNIRSVEFKLLSIIVCTKLCVQLRARFLYSHTVVIEDSAT